MTQEDSGGEKNLANPGRCSENKCTGYQKSLSKIIWRFFLFPLIWFLSIRPTLTSYVTQKNSTPDFQTPVDVSTSI